MHKKPVTFLNLPEYPGGKEQFKQFVKKHLKYPREALDNKIEGLVLLNAEVSHRGDVSNVKVEKGIGYGCDEEASRILGLMKFGGVKNRGVKVKTTKRFKINFKLPGKTSHPITYSFKETKKDITKPEGKSSGYSYTINIQ